MSKDNVIYMEDWLRNSNHRLLQEVIKRFMVYRMMKAGMSKKEAEAEYKRVKLKEKKSEQ